MVPLLLKPVVANLDLVLDLIAISTSPRHIIILSVWDFLGHSNEVISHMGSLHRTLIERRSNLHGKSLAVPFSSVKDVLV